MYVSLESIYTAMHSPLVWRSLELTSLFGWSLIENIVVFMWRLCIFWVNFRGSPCGPSLRVDVQDGAECWLCSLVSEWGWCSGLNGALIRLIHSALVYKRPLHNRHSLIARCPRRVVPSMSVLFLKAGKQRCREGRREKQPQGSCESASEHSTSRHSAKILFQLSHWYLCHRKQQHCGEYSQTPWSWICFISTSLTGGSLTL